MNNNVTYMFGKDVAEAQMGLPFEVDDTVNIPRGEYEELLEDSLFLSHLEDVGVDSWEGYGEALQAYNDTNEEGEANGD